MYVCSYVHNIMQFYGIILELTIRSQIKTYGSKTKDDFTTIAEINQLQFCKLYISNILSKYYTYGII